MSEAVSDESLKEVKVYEQLGEAAAGAGPLHQRTVHLVRLGMAMGARSEGAVHSHVRRALAAGATAAEVWHAAALAISTLGFPAAVFPWVEDMLGKR